MNFKNHQKTLVFTTHLKRLWFLIGNHNKIGADRAVDPDNVVPEVLQQHRDWPGAFGYISATPQEL